MNLLCLQEEKVIRLRDSLQKNINQVKSDIEYCSSIGECPEFEIDPEYYINKNKIESNIFSELLIMFIFA